MKKSFRYNMTTTYAVLHIIDTAVIYTYIYNILYNRDIIVSYQNEVSTFRNLMNLGLNDEINRYMKVPRCDYNNKEIILI